MVNGRDRSSGNRGMPRPGMANIDAPSFLMSAAFHGRLEEVRVLLREGAHPNYAAEDGSTALLMAAQMGQVNAPTS